MITDANNERLITTIAVSEANRSLSCLGITPRSRSRERTRQKLFPSHFSRCLTLAESRIRSPTRTSHLWRNFISRFVRILNSRLGSSEWYLERNVVLRSFLCILSEALVIRGNFVPIHVVSSRAGIQFIISLIVYCFIYNCT